MTQSALDLVIAALERIREKSDHEPRASRTALARLQAADHVTVPVVTTAALTDCLSPTARHPQTAGNKADLLAAVRERIGACTRCAHLACSPTQEMFGARHRHTD